MKNLHILPAEKFTKDFIINTNLNFGQENNFFFIIKNNSYNNIELPNDIHNVKYVNMENEYFKIFFETLKYEKIFFHNISYAHPILLLLFSLISKKIKKQFWIMWGQDLYCYESKKTNIKYRISEFFRKLYIKNLFGIIFWVKGDYELACKWYKTNAKFFVGGYSSNNLSMIINARNNRKKYNDEYIRIQLGNSAAIRNRHLPALEIIKKMDTGNLIIYAPLSYAGNEEYINSVIQKGTELFGERFIPLKTVMNAEDYVNYLNTIDIGVFNTDRQMGLGNISTLIGLGKKVFINDYTTSWDFYYDKGIKIFPFNKIEISNKNDLEVLLAPLTEHEQRENFDCIIKSKESFAQCWKDIYNSN